MQDIVRIATVSSESVKDFDTQVNELVSKGWVLSNMTVLPIGNSVRYIATLVEIAERWERSRG